MKQHFSIRLATADDALGILEVYKPFVTDSIVSFEYEVPSLSEFQERIETIAEEYPYLVLFCENEIIGYAYGSKHRSRAAYDWSVETTIYMDEKFHGQGLAAILYGALFQLLTALGHCNAFAGITLPNEKSRLFHAKMGFQDIGTFKNIGYKFGKWHDTHWMQRDLAGHGLEPKKPIRMADLEVADIDECLNWANEKLGK